MPRRRAVPRRKPIFIGVEGRSEEAFVKFLQRCCDGEGLHVHLSVSVAGGGDSRGVVQNAGRWLARSVTRHQFAEMLVMLDADRVEQDRQAGRDPLIATKEFGLQLIYLQPNLEGLLLRLHDGYERRQVAARSALHELRATWSEYRKPPTADELSRHFTLDDLRRAARHDSELQRILRVVGLLA